ncbi:UNVERIFIED_ORG: gas vesicle protein [Arthrobacter globiformis]|nr:gas vesicle protein [Arthrobacter globiformis]
MSDNPDAIRADIEATRNRLGTNVDAVADKVTPSNIVHRQTGKVKDAVFGVKDKIMGTAEHATHSTSGSLHHAAHTTGGGVHQATDAAGNALHGAGEAIADAPHQVAAKTQGNPLAAGLIAFGAGLLVSSLIPASQKEREAADALKTAAEPMTSQLTEAAKDMAQGLKEPAQDAMENVKATATDAAQHVKDEGQTAASDVKATATDAKDHVQNT